MMEECVASARAAGVFKEFHVFSDRHIAGCNCYDAMEIVKAGHLFKLVYLKAGISKLLFDYFVWIDADSWFVRNPRDVLGCLGKSPIHVPLTTNLSAFKRDEVAEGIATQKLVDLMVRGGIFNSVYLSTSGFWIVHRDVIDRVCELVQHFWGIGAEGGLQLGVGLGLGYAMQMLCGNPEAHLITVRPDLWASEDQWNTGSPLSTNATWTSEAPLREEAISFKPSIIHLRRQKSRSLIPQISGVSGRGVGQVRVLGGRDRCLR
jgi:hypothetical protein